MQGGIPAPRPTFDLSCFGRSAAEVTLPVLLSGQCEKAADGRPEQEPVLEEAGAAADQRHRGVHVRAHVPAGGVRGEAGRTWEPSVRAGR